MLPGITVITCDAVTLTLGAGIPLKYQDLRVTDGSIYTSLLCLIIKAVEWNSSDDIDVFSVKVPSWIVEPAEALSRLHDSRGGLLKVELYSPSEGDLGTFKIRPLNIDVAIRASREAHDYISLKELYRLAMEAPLRLDSYLLKRLASMTSEGGPEFLIAYLEWGEVIILEGEVDRISIPFLEQVKVSYHTHPRGGCAFSRADLASSLDLMVHGGIGEGVVTTDCATYMYRIGFLLEEDYIVLKKYRKPVLVNLDELNVKSVDLRRVSF